MMPTMSIQLLWVDHPRCRLVRRLGSRGCPELGFLFFFDNCTTSTQTRKTKLSYDHPDTLSSIANLASTFWKQGRWEEPEQLDVQAMETRETKLVTDHPSMLSMRVSL
jgi:hypothetical protein